MFGRNLVTLAALLLFVAAAHAADVEADIYTVGVAEVDITPTHPIRLNGFGFRRTESEGVNHAIHVRAISIRHNTESEPLLLMTTDVLGIPDHLRAELVKRLNGKVKADRFAITATHTHCGPMLSGANPTIFGVPIPEDHQKHIDDYTKVFLDKVEQATLAALADARPARMYWGVGTVDFAKNRRAAGGPTDHDLPMLLVRDAKTNAVRAVYTTYACHCVTLSHNKIGGDWAGYAAEAIRAHFPDAIGLVSIGCGADQNPTSGVTGDKVETAQVQGRQLAAEVKRLAGGFLAPVRGKPISTMKSLELPLSELPTRESWETKAKRTDAIGHHARVQLAKLDRKEALATKIDYMVQTWAFGDSLAMVHLPGEVVVDYSHRLKRELDRGRVWITAYANTNPCYIPSERVLKEGGYEGGGAMVYYDVPVPFKPGLENTIIAEVKAQLGKPFAATIDPTKTRGEQPKSPQQSRSQIHTDTRYAVDLVVAEPLVADPVAMAFGPDGKLWVAEMLDYPSGKAGRFEPGGRIRVVEDKNRDGVFESATTFLDGVPFPTGVLPWRNGVLVTAAPDILFAEDTNGDGLADKITKLFSGFGTENYQARVNGLAFGLDGWIYGSCGLFGGKILSHKTSKTFALGDRDFRIKPDTGEIKPATGRTQQGRVRDDWDNWFGCDNSNLAWHYVLAEHYLLRNPHVAPPRPVVSVPTGPDANRLFPIHSPQLFQLSGPAGRTTGACGIGIYRDDRLGNALTGNTFTCEPVNQLVHRRVLKPTGTSFSGTRALEETDREFLASADGWFRPVQAVTGPDGGLWIVDMYRFLIEHPRWIPPTDLANLDVRAGAGLGRIYRVRLKDAKPEPIPDLSKLDTIGLIAALDSANGWQRDMVTELLAWRGDKSAIPHLQKLATDAKRPETRLHALAALERLGGIDVQTVLARLSDPHAGVRRHAVRLTEPFLEKHHQLAEQLTKIIADDDPQVRLQLAYSLGNGKVPSAGRILAQLVVKHRDDVFLVAAAMSSLTRENFRAFVEHHEILQFAGTPILPNLVATAIGLGDEQVLSSLIKFVTTKSGDQYAAWQFTTLETVLDVWGRRQKGIPLPADVETAVAAARQVARNTQLPDTLRTAAIRLYGRDPKSLSDDITKLTSLLGAQSSSTLQATVVATLGRMTDDRAAEALVKNWSGYTPAIQSQVMAVLLDRDRWLNKVFAAIEGGQLPRSAIPAGRRQGLLTHPDAKVRAAAEKAFAGAIKTDRQQVIDSYIKGWPTTADKTRGKEVFKKSCATCHLLDGLGHAVGPDLAAVVNKTRDYLIAEILDPNRNIDNRYLEYAADTADGRTLRGLLASESAAAITLRQADGKDTTLLRTDLEKLKSSGRSLMPEGLEKDIPPAAMADLIAYLATAAKPPKQVAGNTPKIVREQDGQFLLRAADAEIHGSDITFEPEFGNIGYWHGVQDHVAWRVMIPRAAEFDVYLDFACSADAAGNAFLLEGGQKPLVGKIASTGQWSRYSWVKLGTITLAGPESRLTFRPNGEMLNGALVDLRTVLLVPKGQPPKYPSAATANEPQPQTAAQVAIDLLDDSKKTTDRETLLTKHADKSAEILSAMTTNLLPGKEEYRRIPWVWRVAIAAGKRNKTEEIRAILDVSLPKAGERLRDWQAVVIGGGIINGIGQLQVWPAVRIREVIGADVQLSGRWLAALEVAQRMADDTKVPTGTRYDAIRMDAMRGWEKAGKQLTKYLAKGTNAELQMGAVSGCVDIDSPEATTALLTVLPDLTGQNRKLASEGLLRSEKRMTALLDAVEKGTVAATSVDAAAIETLRESMTENIRKRATKLFPKP